MKKKSHTALLIKAGLIDTFRLNSLRYTHGAARIRAIGLTFAIGVSIAVLLGMLCVYFWFMGKALHSMGRLDALLSVSSFAGSFLCFFFSIYKSPGFLFSFRDFDLLASLPVKDSAILSSKVFMLYISDALFAVGIALPGFAVYGALSSAGFWYYVFALIFALLLPIIPMLLGAILSFFVMRLSSRAKKSNLVTLVISFALTIAVIFASFTLQNVNTEAMGDAFVLFDGYVKAYFPAAWLAEALRNASALHGALYVLLPSAVFAAFLALFSRHFRSLNSALNERFSRSDYKMRSLKVSPPLAALYKKELRFYFSSSTYVLNTAIGPVLMTVFVIALLLLNFETIAQLTRIEIIAGAVPVISAAVITFCVAISCTTSSSISLEGKQLSIIKALPVRFSGVALSKILVNMTITVPLAVIDVVLLSIALSTGLAAAVSLLLPVLAYCVLAPLIGLYVNLRLPKLDWKSHTQIVKQSASTGVTLLLNMLAFAIPCAAYYFLRPASLNGFLLGVFGCVAVVCALLWALLMSNGKRLYGSISE